MKIKLIAYIWAVAFSALSAAASAITVGTYSFTSADLANQAVLSSGQVWDSTTNAYTTTPAALTDADATTYTSTYPSTGYDNVTIDLGFGQAITNGAGADIALFFLSEQSTNTVNVTIGGTSNSSPLLFSDVYDASGNLQVAIGLTPSPVYFSVIELNLDDYGLAAGDVMSSPLSVNLIQNDAAIAVSLSMVGSLNSTVVPVPAAVWLFGSGLLGLVGVVRRRK